MTRHVAAPLLIATTAAIAGCGAERVDVPDVSRPSVGAPPVVRSFTQAGLTFRAPSDWPFGAGAAPLAASTSSGSATIALWRYPRTEPRPEGDAAFDVAEEALRDAVQARDGSFRLDSARRVRVDGAPGIELLGTERVAGRERRVRSTHVYARQAEIVVDAYAAERDFDAVDGPVFRPLVSSLKIDPPGA